MKLEDILSEWSTDSKIDATQIITETVRSANLHAKYYSLLSKERLRYEKKKSERAKLIHFRTEWLNGDLDGDTIKEFGWKPNPKKILKTDFERYLAADEYVIEANLELAVSKEKVELLVDIIKAINNRSYSINNIINWNKFQAGVN